MKKTQLQIVANPSRQSAIFTSPYKPLQTKELQIFVNIFKQKQTFAKVLTQNNCNFLQMLVRSCKHLKEFICNDLQGFV